MAETKARENLKCKQNNHRKKVGFSVPEVGIAVVIQVLIRKNTIEDVLLDGGF